MAKTRKQKEESVADLTEKLSKAKSVVFANYQGLKMSQLSDLRDKLREIDAQLLITKNTLMERALKEASLPVPSEEIEIGPTATLFSFNDEILPIKALVKTLKDAQIGKIKGGLLDSQILDELAINRLATLPGKQELQAKVVGSLSSPLYGLVTVCQANLRNLVYALDQIRIQRG